MANTLGCTGGLSVCIGRIGCVDVDAPPSLLTLAPEPLPTPLPKQEVLPPLPAMLWTPLPVLVPNCAKLGQSLLICPDPPHSKYWIVLFLQSPPSCTRPQVVQGVVLLNELPVLATGCLTEL